jgi:hypothetical protein
MKRFLAFAGSDYYPLGGFDDFLGAFDTFSEARAAVKASGLLDYGWGQVVDINRETKTQVYLNDADQTVPIEAPAREQAP